jgi:penicillin-binding protein 1B
MRLKEYWDRLIKKLAPLKEKLYPIYEKTKPVREALFNEKTAKAFRITYDVVWNLILIFIIVLVLGVSLVLGVGAGYFASLVKDEYPRSYEEMKKDIYNYEEQSELYFAGNIHLGDLRSDIVREGIKIEDVSQHVINGIIAVEDENFFTHNGVVPKAVFRALFQELTNASTQTGGSTLTQQLVKNQILTNEVSFERKAKEILLALRLEKFFSKEEILEAYLNSTTFGRNSNGRNIAGIQAASKGIFGVDAKDLNIAQAAYIAGLPQSPSAYTPFTNKGTLKSKEGLAPGLNRQKYVLQRMLEEGYISKQEYEDAKSYDIVADFIPPQEEKIDKYKYLTQEAENRAIQILMQFHYEKDGYTKEAVETSKVLRERYSALAYRDLRQNGYKIYTTIDKEVYDKFQEVTKEFGKNFPTQTIERDGEKVEVPLGVASMLMENKTGRIIAFSGGIDFEKQNQNHATQSVRSNGSTMKPLLVYGPAFDMGLAAPGTPLADVDLGIRNQNGKVWPNNITNRYYGLVSARTALTHSYNVSAVYLYKRILHTNPVENYLEKLGITSLADVDYTNESMALGALHHGITVEENTNAFAAFGNHGQFTDSYMIEKIEDKDGNVIYEHKVEPVEVFSPQAAYLTVDVMRDVVKNGTARSIPGQLNVSMDLAGKTGTSTNNYDKWFVGLNPNVTLGVWVGFEKQQPVPSSVRHLNYWADLMNATVSLKPDLVGVNDRFEQPKGIVRKSYCQISGMLPSKACSSAGLVKTDLFIDKYAPTKTDDTLSSGGKYVEINGKRFLALDSTPSEFTKSGVLINPDYIDRMSEGLPKRISPSELFLNNSLANVLVADAKLAENGKIPSAPNISISGKTISWKKHGEDDVVGYRVYEVVNGKKGSKLASIPAGETLSYTIPKFGTFAVTAVDIAGQESSLSNPVKNNRIPDKVDDIIDDISSSVEGFIENLTSQSKDKNKDENESENEKPNENIKEEREEQGNLS